MSVRGLWVALLPAAIIVAVSVVAQNESRVVGLLIGRSLADQGTPNATYFDLVIHSEGNESGKVDRKCSAPGGTWAGGKGLEEASHSI